LDINIKPWIYLRGLEINISFGLPFSGVLRYILYATELQKDGAQDFTWKEALF